MRLVIISDTHGYHWGLDVPDGDVLIHAGDFSELHGPPATKDFDNWLGTLPHPHKLVIAGNHDFCFEDPDMRPVFGNCAYLHDTGTVINGFNFYGAPWQSGLPLWAFYLPYHEVRKRWACIPVYTDVLITHVPPWAVLDYVPKASRCVGCVELMKRFQHISPRLHVFGHVHEGYGQDARGSGVTFINGSSCDEHYRMVNPPIIFDL